MTKAEQHKAWRQQRRARGLCLSCPSPAKIHHDGTVANYCPACQQAKTAAKTARYVKKGWHTTAVVQASDRRPGLTTCLWCGHPYDSPDAPNDRYHATCRAAKNGCDIVPEWVAVG